MTKEKKPFSLLPQLLGGKIKSHRNILGWTQATLAELVGVDVETISRFERGTTVPSVLKLEQIAGVLNLPLAELLRSSSSLPQDQAIELLEWMKDLPETDRKFVLDATQKLCLHLLKRDGFTQKADETPPLR